MHQHIARDAGCSFSCDITSCNWTSYQLALITINLTVFSIVYSLSLDMISHEDQQLLSSIIGANQVSPMRPLACYIITQVISQVCMGTCLFVSTWHLRKKLQSLQLSVMNEKDAQDILLPIVCIILPISDMLIMLFLTRQILSAIIESITIPSMYLSCCIYNLFR